MFSKYEAEYLSKVDPFKENVNPVDPSKRVRCKDYLAKYYECVEQGKETGRLSSINQKCNSLIRICSLCYKLSEKQFKEAASPFLLEEMYLDKYLKKQLRVNEIIKPKDF